MSISLFYRSILFFYIDKSEQATNRYTTKRVHCATSPRFWTGLCQNEAALASSSAQSAFSGTSHGLKGNVTIYESGGKSLKYQSTAGPQDVPRAALSVLPRKIRAWLKSHLISWKCPPGLPIFAVPPATFCSFSTLKISIIFLFFLRRSSSSKWLRARETETLERPVRLPISS